MYLHLWKVISISLSISVFLSSICTARDSYAQGSPFIPSVNDNNLKVESISTGFKKPISIAFLGPNDLLVVDRFTGVVHRIVDGQFIGEPLLDVNVFYKGESGLVGIETAKNANGKIYVFLYYTESKLNDESVDEKKNIGNRLYRYELINNKLVNPKLLLSLPKGSSFHNGGAIKLGPDGYLYIPVGDLSPGFGQSPNGTLAQNNQSGSTPNLSGGILRMTQDGKAIGGIIGDSFPESLYFAYGIRNSFGVDFDPITSNMWDTENGPSFGDEINIVRPGFNSGWSQVQGIWKPDFDKNWVIGPYFNKSDNLVDFNGKGNYSPPEFTWEDTVGPTAIKFLTTPKLGSQYENDIFVGDVKFGRIYHFDLDKNRTNLQLSGALSDRVANSSNELEPIIFGQGFNAISDLEIGPDGYLYVVSFDYNDKLYGYRNNPSCPPIIDAATLPYYQGTIYRIVPKDTLSEGYNDISVPMDIVTYMLPPSDTVLNSKIVGAKDRIVLKENETHWSSPLRLNATYIEGSFRLIDDKNETGKDKHAGLVWQEGNNKTYYAFVRYPEIVLSDSIGEKRCATLVAENDENWNKITILNSAESIYVFHNGFLRMKVPKELNGTDISLVGMRSYNTEAEFGPLKIGHYPDNLSRFLLPNVAEAEKSK